MTSRGAHLLLRTLEDLRQVRGCDICDLDCLEKRVLREDLLQGSNLGTPRGASDAVALL